MQKVKTGDRIYLGDGVFGYATCIAKDLDGFEKVQCLLDDSEDYSYKTIPIELVRVIPTLAFANEEVTLIKVKPGTLVQIVGGHFCHITRLTTSKMGEIYIETTDSQYITYAPSELYFIG
jgi:preprotein translocase subunit YajC